MIISNRGLFRKLFRFYTLIISYIPKRGHLNVIISTKSLFIIISNSLLLMLLLLLLLLLLLWQRRKWEGGLKIENFRGPELQKMPEEGEENEKVRESESEKVAEPLPANKKRIEANKLSPEANTFSRGKVMVNLSHSKLKRKGHTIEKYTGNHCNWRPLGNPSSV